MNFEPSPAIVAIYHPLGTSLRHPTRPYHPTTPSSYTAGTPRTCSGSNYHSPRQAKTKMPHSILHMNGNNWSAWCSKPGKHIPNKGSRHIAPQHSRASKTPSSRLNRTSQRGKPVWLSWTTRSFLPPTQEQIYGPWSPNNSRD